MSELLKAPYVLEYTYTRSTGPVHGRCLENLRYEILEGVKAQDGRVFFPPREYDEAGDTTTDEWVTLRPFGVVKSYTWVAEPRDAHPLDRPFAFALIQLEGTDTPFPHIVDCGSPKKIKTGMRVRVRWAKEKTGTILDIEAFEPQSPILPGPVHMQFDVVPGKNYSMYLKALQEGRFIGGKCQKTGNVYVPPKGATPDSGLPTEEIVDVKDVGVLTSFTVIRIPFEGQKLKPPYCFGAIVLDGADLPIYHLISGVSYDEIRMGMRVKAKWKPREEWGPSLENIEYFEPTGEPDAEFDTYAEHL